MLRFKTPPALLGALLGALLLASPADASIVQALELDELVDQSDRILLGRVLFSESFQHPNGLLGTWHIIIIFVMVCILVSTSWHTMKQGGSHP